MQVKDKPATSTPERLFGSLLIAVGGLFIGDFIWAMATYEPTIHQAPPTVWGILVVGILAGAILVGVGVAALLNSIGELDIPRVIGWKSQDG